MKNKQKFSKADKVLWNDIDMICGNTGASVWVDGKNSYTIHLPTNGDELDGVYKEIRMKSLMKTHRMVSVYYQGFCDGSEAANAESEAGIEPKKPKK